MESSRHLLVVDDKRTNRRLIREIFKTDFTVYEAENGEAALTLLREEKGNMDVIILDLMMPVMDGFAFLEEKLVEPALRDIPTLVISETNNDASEERALDLGADDFITRPFNSRIVKRRVEKVLIGVGTQSADLSSAQVMHGAAAPLGSGGSNKDAGSAFGVSNAQSVNGEVIDYIARQIHGGIISCFCTAGFPIRSASESLVKLLGYSDAAEFTAAVSGNFINAIDHADRPRITESIFSQLKVGDDYTFEYRLIRDDGERVWVRDMGRRAEDQNGQPYVTGVCVDITDSRNAMQDLRMFESAFVLAQEQNKDIIIRYDVTSRTAYFPPAAAYLLGLSTKVGDMPLSLMEKGIVADESLAPLLHLSTNMQSGVPSGEGVLVFRTRGGEMRKYIYKYGLVYSSPSWAVITLSQADSKA